MQIKTVKWMKLGLKVKLLHTLNQLIIGDLNKLNINKKHSSKLISFERTLRKIKSDLEDIMFKEKEIIDDLDYLEKGMEQARVSNQEYHRFIYNRHGMVATNVFYGNDVIPATELYMDNRIIETDLKDILEKEIEEMFEIRINKVIELSEMEVK